MSDMVYAVHTRTCTYLLDEDGVCGWVLSPTGDDAQDRCIGAQFVACLDLREEGGLIGELRVGAFGLFARRESGRFVLLKTSLIEHIDYRRSSAPDLSVTTALPEMEAAQRYHQAHSEPAWSSAAPSEQPPVTQRLGADSSEHHPMPYQVAAAQPSGRQQMQTTRMQQVDQAHRPYREQSSTMGRPQIEDHHTGPMPPGYDTPAPVEPGYGYEPVKPAMVTSREAMVAMDEQVTSSEALDLIDLDELSTFSSEVTLTIPLYRPDPDESVSHLGNDWRGWPAGSRRQRG